MERNKVLVMHQGSESAEHTWLTCGLLWVAIGTLALGLFGSVARVGRMLFGLTLFVHMIETLYAALRMRTVGLNAQTWFLKTVVPGPFVLLALDLHIRRMLRVRRLR